MLSGAETPAVSAPPRSMPWLVTRASESPIPRASVSEAWWAIAVALLSLSLLKANASEDLALSLTCLGVGGRSVHGPLAGGRLSRREGTRPPARLVIQAERASIRITATMGRVWRNVYFERAIWRRGASLEAGGLIRFFILLISNVALAKIIVLLPQGKSPPRHLALTSGRACPVLVG